MSATPSSTRRSPARAGRPLIAVRIEDEHRGPRRPERGGQLGCQPVSANAQVGKALAADARRPAPGIAPRRLAPRCRCTGCLARPATPTRSGPTAAAVAAATSTANLTRLPTEPAPLVGPACSCWRRRTGAPGTRCPRGSRRRRSRPSTAFCRPRPANSPIVRGDVARGHFPRPDARLRTGAGENPALRPGPVTERPGRRHRAACSGARSGRRASAARRSRRRRRVPAIGHRAPGQRPWAGRRARAWPGNRARRGWGEIPSLTMSPAPARCA